MLADVRFPVRDGAGDIVAIAGIDMDVTAQKRSEAELAELLRRVETARDVATEAAASKSRFLANMSHELRTPLNAIIGFTRIVSRNSEALPERQVDNLSNVLVSAEHLLALIDEILDLSRIEAGEVTLDISETNVTDVLREVTDSLEPLVERPRVQLVVDADTALPRIDTDRDKLKQILLNLVSNAVKYTDEGTIAVRAESVDGRLRIDVTDTGVGIPAEELEIFDEFHRADGAISPSRPGTGLGLTISRRLARTLGGDVTVESIPESDRPSPRSTSPRVGWRCAEPRGCCVRQTLLIVEDTELDRELLVQIFESSYDIRLAPTGRPPSSSRRMRRRT